MIEQNICYNYDENYVYVGPSEMFRMVNNKYLLPNNATLIEPIEYDQETEYLTFNGQGWVINDLTIDGTFYLKSNGSEFGTIAKKDLDLYTTTPRPSYFEDGDIIYFENDVWIEPDQSKRLALVKREVCKQCFDFYEQKRVFSIQNGHSVTLIANQDLQNNIGVWKSSLEYRTNILNEFASLSEAIYNYNGIMISYDNIIKLSSYISYIRSKYVAIRNYHIGDQILGIVGKINELTTISEVEEHDYTVDQNNNPVTNPATFVL